MSGLPTSEEKQRPWHRQWPVVWQSLLIVVAAAVFVVVWWVVPPALYRYSGGSADAQLKAITDTRTALLAGLVGVGALLTFWLNFRMYRITAKTLNVTEQGHITERYTKAIEQLGDTALAVRLVLQP
jgi:flagellar biosynthesis/type III secretory pathway M-ring protein FliF/YscJ